MAPAIIHPAKCTLTCRIPVALRAIYNASPCQEANVCAPRKWPVRRCDSVAAIICFGEVGQFFVVLCQIKKLRPDRLASSGIRHVSEALGFASVCLGSERTSHGGTRRALRWCPREH